MAKNWKKEVARDCIALGSIPFYIIVIIRAIVGQYPIFVYQLLIALAVLIVSALIIKNTDMYVARMFVLLVFTSMFYEHNLYTIFAFLLLVLMIISSSYLKIKTNRIIKGALLGIVGSLVSYYLAPLVPFY